MPIQAKEQAAAKVAERIPSYTPTSTFTDSLLCSCLNTPKNNVASSEYEGFLSPKGWIESKDPTQHTPQLEFTQSARTKGREPEGL